MRLASLFVVVALAACTETGAHLTFSAPEGPRTAASFRVVLAAPGDITAIANQRIAPGDRATHTVTYYRQRTTGGEARQAIDRVDGFRLRIAPDADTADIAFIPFVLVYDAQGRIAGIGTYRYGASSEPRSIEVTRDEIHMYTLHVEPVVEVTDIDAAGPGQAQVIECTRADDTSFASGLVWRPLGGGELRVVLPETGDDATGRALDLDCDDHAVTADDPHADCDDTRDWFHPGAEEACDGHDTNCDDAATIPLPCESAVCPALAGVQTGVALCDDRTGTSASCAPTASCSCTVTNGNYVCNYCEMPWAVGATSGSLRPCQPTQGVIRVYGYCSDSSPCTIEVLGARNGWIAEVASNHTQGFGNVVDGVTSQFVLKVKRPEGATYEVQASPGAPLSDVDFLFRTATSTRYVGWQLRMLEEQPATTGCPTMPIMRCYPM